MPAQLFAKNRLSSSVDGVKLKDILGQVYTDCRNLHGGRPFPFEWSMTLPLWHTDAVYGWGRPSHCLQCFGDEVGSDGRMRPLVSPRRNRVNSNSLSVNHKM